jgi:flagellar basal-body rod protein FlgG
MLAYRDLDGAQAAMEVLQARMEVSAHNLSNIDTPGFKATRLVQEDLPYTNGAGPGVRVAGTRLDMTQGRPVHTGSRLDLCICGAGFLRVRNVDDGYAYTRNGMLTLDPEGRLVTALGNYPLAAEIVIPRDTMDIQITSNGRVFVKTPGVAEPQEIGELEIATFPAPESLRPLGGSLYAESAASGAPSVGPPESANRGWICVGSYECSNVDPERERINVVRIQRAYALWNDATAMPPTPRVPASASAADR